jgi:hypothetical protein
MIDGGFNPIIVVGRVSRFRLASRRYRIRISRDRCRINVETGVCSDAGSGSADIGNAIAPVALWGGLSLCWGWLDLKILTAW